MQPKTISFLSSLVFGALISSPAFAHDHHAIHVKMVPAAKQTAHGDIVLRALKDGRVEIKGHLSGLKSGHHGMHMHTIGDCSDPADGFKKAGPHFNPDETQHGGMGHGHAGDLGNIEVNSKGKANFSIKTYQFSLDKNSQKYIVGRSVMIHADQDDEKTDPAGNSGARILCGVIEEPTR